MHATTKEMHLRCLVVKIVSAVLAINIAVNVLTLVAELISAQAFPGSPTHEFVRYAVHSYAALWLKCFNVIATVVGSVVLLYLTKVIKTSVNPFIMCQCRNCCKGEPWSCELEDYGHIRDASSSPLSLAPKRDLISFLQSFTKWVNLDALKKHLYQNRVLTSEDGNEMWSTIHATNTQKVEQFLLIMTKKGSGSAEKLIEALEATAVDGNGGHDDLAELLKEEYSSNDCCEEEGRVGEVETADLESGIDEPHSSLPLVPTRMLSTAAMALQWPGLDVHAFEDINLASGGEAKLYNREQKGLKIYTPENAVKDHALIHVSVFTRGQLQLPERCELISAVYAICIYGKLAKPVTLEIEHCAAVRHQTDASYVRFVHAPFSEVLPYRFEYLKRARTDVESFVGEQSKYGSVTVPANGSHEFCALLAVVQKRRIFSQMMRMISNEQLQCRYRVQVFFEALAPATEWLDEWRAHVVLFKDHEPWHQVFQEKYPANKFLKYDEDLVVTIEKETTVLLRAERSDTSCGAAGSWKISATSSTTLSKKEVDNFQGLLDTSQLSTCIFHLKWVQQPSAAAATPGPPSSSSSSSLVPGQNDYPSEVYLRLELKGARKPFESSSRAFSHIDLLICFSPKRIANGLGQILSS